MVEIGRLFRKKVETADDLIVGEAESAEADTFTWQVTNLYGNLKDYATSKMSSTGHIWEDLYLFARERG